MNSRNDTVGTPKFSAYARHNDSAASLVTPYGLNGRVGASSATGSADCPYTEELEANTNRCRRRRRDCLQQPVGHDEVVVAVGRELVPRRAHARLGGEVEDDVDILEQRSERRRQQVGLDELDVRRAPEGRQVGLLELAVVVRRERVDAADLPARGSDVLGELAADEPGDTGDEGQHRATLPLDVRALRNAADDERGEHRRERDDRRAGRPRHEVIDRRLVRRAAWR